MPTFFYEATSADGTPERGRYDGIDISEVIYFLQRKKLVPVSVVEEGTEPRVRFNLSTVLFERVASIDRIVMVRNLGVALKAGLGILESLDILIEDTPKKILKDILRHARENIERGQQLSSTLALYPQQFSPVFIGLLKAGEASGQMDQSLSELAEQLTKEHTLVRKVRSALMYPMLLLVASIAVVALLLIFVLPRLAKTFELSRVELPLITKIFVAMSNAILNHPIIDIVVIVAFVYGLTYFRRTDAGKRLQVWLSLRVPYLRDLVKKIVLIRFTRGVGGLLKNGINIVESLTLAAATVGNDEYEKKILTVADDIKSGEAFSDALKPLRGLFPHLLINLIAVGERTGTLSYVLKTFSDFYEDEVDRLLKDLAGFIEPLLLLLMGFVIGSIALSILLPIYQLVGKFT